MEVFGIAGLMFTILLALLKIVKSIDRLTEEVEAIRRYGLGAFGSGEERRKDS